MLRKIRLIGEQKKVLSLSRKGPIYIKGVAGSGKTTIAIYRAMHLLNTESELFSEPSIIIFTFNRTLSDYIRSLVDELGLSEIEVTTFHSWAYRFLRNEGFNLNIINDEEKLEVIDEIKKHYNHKISNKTSRFFAEEFSWINGNIFINEHDYVNSTRVGRGSDGRLSKEEKKIVWQMFKKYEEYLKRNKLIDYDYFAMFVLYAIKKNPNFEPPYTHIIVDEAQDFTKAQMLVISKLVSPNTNSITIIADAAQKIYKTGFALKDVGINIKGRTVELKKNYRNNAYIAKLASSLLDKEPDDLKTKYTELEIVNKGGEKPILYIYYDRNEMYRKLIENIKRDIRNRKQIAILHRSKKGIDELWNVLEKNDINAEMLRVKKIEHINLDSLDSNYVKLCTMSSVKGLEFDIVHIVDVNKGMLPYEKISDDKNDVLHISTERRLLYTCMTRAREKLYLYVCGEPSVFINELNTMYMKVIEEDIAPF